MYASAKNWNTIGIGMKPICIAENEWLIVINKPVGLITHSDGRTVEPSLADWVGENYPALRGVGGAWVSPQGESIVLNGLVHRLDRTTSGVILAAKNDAAFAYLKNEFKERRVAKEYLVRVSGSMEAAAGTVVAEIMRTSTPPKQWYARVCEASDKRAAVTEWEVVRREGEYTLLKLIPKTGRTHQIRVHLASIGHPIVGDALYGGDTSRRSSPALHAAKISLTLPDSSQAVYEAPLPGDFSY